MANINIRIPREQEDIKQRIEKAVEQEQYKKYNISASQFIIAAIVEKLERENK